MKSKIAWALAPVLCLAASAVQAQTAGAAAGANSQSTGIGVGIGAANSRSTAISGQGGRAAAQASNNGNNALTINGAAQPTTTTANVNQNLTGTSTIKNVPAVFAPGLSAAGLETCLGSVSGGGAAVGFGASFGTTIPDPGCNARLDARTLWSFGLKKAALARLCLTPDIYRSMPDVCGVYLPQPVAYGAAVALPPNVRQAYAGGPIELIDGRTGQPRICNDYNAERARCVAWADGAPVRLASAHHAKPKKATDLGSPDRHDDGCEAQRDDDGRRDSKEGMNSPTSVYAGRSKDLPRLSQ